MCTDQVIFKNNSSFFIKKRPIIKIGLLIADLKPIRQASLAQLSQQGCRQVSYVNVQPHIRYWHYSYQHQHALVGLTL